MTTERFASLVMTVLRGSEQLRQCDPLSVIAAAVQAAQLHLEPGPLQEAHLVPFWSNKRKCYECTFILGYRGVIQLAHRAGVDTWADTVYEADEFDYCRGSGANDFLRHKPKYFAEDRGNVLGYYAIGRWKVDGEHHHVFEIASVDAVRKHRDRFAKSPDKGPWVNNFESMAHKTLVLMCSPFLPKSANLQRALAADGTVRTSIEEITPDMAEDAWVDREHANAAELSAPPVSGEVIDVPPPPEDLAGVCEVCGLGGGEHETECPQRPFGDGD